MRDWAIEYVLHVLEKMDWSANRLAQEAGLAPSTLNRPLHSPDWKNSLSRQTILKIAKASGIDPAPFVPDAMHEEKAIYTVRRPTYERRILDQIDAPATTGTDIAVSVHNGFARITATVDREGLAKLRARLDAIETLLAD